MTTPDNNQLLMDLTDYLADLTRWHTHAEPVTTHIGLTRVTYRHKVRVPPLVAQLEQAQASGDGQARGGTGYESRPAAPLEAVDALVWIDVEAARWVRDLGEDDPGETIACVRLLAGLCASVENCGRRRGRRDRDTDAWCCTWHTIEADARRWWTHARIVTGWDSPAWRPDNTCPVCGRRGGLRIRLEERCGMCVECRESWGPDDYQVLAEHVRTESAEARRTEPPGACRCVWPREVFGLAVMCPRCGSATCVNAVRALGQRRATG